MVSNMKNRRNYEKNALVCHFYIHEFLIMSPRIERAYVVRGQLLTA
jgi:hypothetical protein